ncbi:MAG: NFACT family protein [Clostridiales bacterium]|nr:NFACT family protein [Clostridiales bacterium]
MPLDGFTLSAVADELRAKIVGGRVDKIYQPEKDEVILHIRSRGVSHRLLMTANASHPRVHLTESAKENPMQAPLFCMVLRKHLTGGKILSVEQPEFERILIISIESLNEMGDLSLKKCIAEIMGKHSNIFLLNETGSILEAIKHISLDQSSVRPIQPGMTYTPPPGGKLNPLTVDRDNFYALLEKQNGLKIQEAIFRSFNGVSPLMGTDICLRAGLDPSDHPEEISAAQKEHLFQTFRRRAEEVLNGQFTPALYLDEQGQMLDFACLSLTSLPFHEKRAAASPSQLLETFYREKDKQYRLKQKTADLRKITQGHIDRCVKKQDIYQRTLGEIQDREWEKTRGEILLANMYALQKGMTSFTAENYYARAENGGAPPLISIALDPLLTPSENAQKYFQKYNKGKRTHAALQEQIRRNSEDIAYLEGVAAAVEEAADEADIADIRDELIETGFLKKKKTGKKSQTQKKSKPLRYVSTDGFDIYVGKNNRQNDDLTLRFAAASDLWLHTKEIPGSHVIIRANGKPVSETAVLEAARLAALHSKAKHSSQVPVDYALKKNVKKPAGAKPGMVIYESQKTVYVTPAE